MPPTGVRGTGPVHPRDWTGRQLKQQKATIDTSKDTRDIDEEIRKAYQRGHEAGFSEGIQWVQENYDVFELLEEDEAS